MMPLIARRFCLGRAFRAPRTRLAAALLRGRTAPPPGAAFMKGDPSCHHVKKLMYSVNVGSPDPGLVNCYWNNSAAQMANWPRPCNIPFRGPTAAFCEGPFLRDGQPVRITQSRREGSGEIRPSLRSQGEFQRPLRQRTVPAQSGRLLRRSSAARRSERECCDYWGRVGWRVRERLCSALPAHPLL
jgi:hypothetical protein